jgi:small-conductance mechanosensitive channel
MFEYLDMVYWNNPLSAWLIALSFMIIVGLFVKILSPVLLKRFKQFAARTTTSLDDFIVEVAQKALIPLAYLATIYISLSWLVLPAQLTHIIHVAWLVCLTYYVLRVISATFRKLIYRFLRSRNDSELQEKQVGGLILIINIIIWILGIIFLIDNLGYNVTTLIAGLGIGGIAIALAAQAGHSAKREH